MTRINVGVEPIELCDQHLIAEYHELPRLWSFMPKSPPPEHFVLGKGHMLWCVQWPGMLADRFVALVQEMRRRGFRVNYSDPPSSALNGARPPVDEIELARPIVRQRIIERLATMKRNPTWTPHRS